jgi:hypothetical protein
MFSFAITTIFPTIQKITMPESIKCTQLKLQIDKNIEFDHIDKPIFVLH